MDPGHKSVDECPRGFPDEAIGRDRFSPVVHPCGAKKKEEEKEPTWSFVTSRIPLRSIMFGPGGTASSGSPRGFPDEAIG